MNRPVPVTDMEMLEETDAQRKEARTIGEQLILTDPAGNPIAAVKDRRPHKSEHNRDARILEHVDAFMRGLNPGTQIPAHVISDSSGAMFSMNEQEVEHAAYQLGYETKKAMRCPHNALVDRIIINRKRKP